MTVRVIVKFLVTVFLLFLGFETMVAAFHLLNKPSDRAVYEGMAVLALLCTLLPATLLYFWRKL
jgi:divalent metal cation (Fe/Co/Zn/Cd) transporter